MDIKEFGQFAAALRTFYPREKLIPNKEAAALWFEMLKDLPYQDVTTALQRWVSTQKWSPSIADIRSMVSNSANPELTNDWSEGWEEVTKAIGRYGAWNRQAALDSMSPITRDCVNAIGWENICASENIGVERGHFRTMYESHSQKMRNADQTAVGLRTPTEQRLLDYGSVVKRLE